MTQIEEPLSPHHLSSSSFLIPYFSSPSLTFPSLSFAGIYFHRTDGGLHHAIKHLVITTTVVKSASKSGLCLPWCSMCELSILTVINFNLSPWNMSISADNTRWCRSVHAVHLELVWPKSVLQPYCEDVKNNWKETVDYYRELFLIFPKLIVSRNLFVVRPAGVVYDLSKVLIRGPAWWRGAWPVQGADHGVSSGGAWPARGADRGTSKAGWELSKVLTLG